MESTKKEEISLFDEKAILEENNVKIVIKNGKRKIEKTKKNDNKRTY